MPRRTLIELFASLAQTWVTFSGPLVPPGKNYAESQGYEGFQTAFDAWSASVGLLPAERQDMIDNFSFPAL